MRLTIDLPENLKKAIDTVAKSWNIPLRKAIELILIGDLARKGAYGDLLNQPEVGVEFIKTQDGKLLEGQALYEDVYRQVKAWLNSLLIAEKLVLELAQKEETKATRFSDQKVNDAFIYYREKKGEHWQ